MSLLFTSVTENYFTIILDCVRLYNWRNLVGAAPISMVYMENKSSCEYFCKFYNVQYKTLQRCIICVSNRQLLEQLQLQTNGYYFQLKTNCSDLFFWGWNSLFWTLNNCFAFKALCISLLIWLFFKSIQRFIFLLLVLQPIKAKCNQLMEN